MFILLDSVNLGIQWQIVSASSDDKKSCSRPLVLVCVGGKLLNQCEEAFKICFYQHVVEPSLAHKDASFAV